MGGRFSYLQKRNDIPHVNIIIIHRYSPKTPHGFDYHGVRHFNVPFNQTIGRFLDNFNKVCVSKSDHIKYLFDNDGVEYRHTDIITLKKVYYI